MSERLSDELVANLAVWAADAKPTTREVEALTREVQWWRNDDALGVTAVFDLMNRHGITVEGIVALVDEVCGTRSDPLPWSWHEETVKPDDPMVAYWLGADRFFAYLRRLARGEEA